MLHRAARELGVDLAESIMIGDRCTDIAAANAAGLKQAFLLHGTETEPCASHSLPVSSLAEVAHWLQTQPVAR
jgi:D-glycero-D-manno-heptose 1,7-bisphosphate phosphatase